MALNFMVCGIGKVQMVKAQISRGLAMATVSLSSYWHEPKPGGWVRGRENRTQNQRQSERWKPSKEI